MVGLENAERCLQISLESNLFETLQEQEGDLSLSQYCVVTHHYDPETK